MNEELLVGVVLEVPNLKGSPPVPVELEPIAVLLFTEFSDCPNWNADVCCCEFWLSPLDADWKSGFPVVPVEPPKNIGTSKIDPGRNIRN